MAELTGRPGAALDPSGKTRMADRPREWTPPADLCEAPNRFTVTLNLPGLRRDQISISMPDEMTLVVNGAPVEALSEEGVNHLISERPRVVTDREIRLPRAVDSERTTASLDLGVLTIHLPFRDAGEPGPRSIPIR